MSEMNIKPFRFFTQAILPLDYDDTLSYYECLAKVTAKLNETINVVDVNNENMQSLHDAYVQLESFVNSYFDDLDVQAEIDNKLDEMVTDGTLLELIQPFVDDEIADAVAAWLEENITPTTPAVDATLLVSGAAADSKTVGDKLKADVAPAYSTSATYAVGDYVLYDHTLYKCNTVISTAEAWTAAHWTAVNMSDEISDLNDALSLMMPTIDASAFTWTLKTQVTASGSVSSNPTTSLSNNLLVTGGSKLINKSDPLGMSNQNTLMRVAEYSNNVFIKRTDILTYGDSMIVGENTDSIRIVWGYLNATGNDPTQQDITDHFGLQIIEAAETKTGEIEMAKNLIDGYVVSTTGAVSPTSSYVRTDYIKVTPNTSYFYSGTVYSAAGGAAYDANKQYLGALLPTASPQQRYARHELTLPVGTAYIIVCSLATSELSLIAHGNILNILDGEIQDIDKRVKYLENPSNLTDNELVSLSLFERIGGIGDSYTAGAIYGIPNQTATAHYGISWPEILGRHCGVTGIAFADIGVNAKTWQTSEHCLPLLKTTQACNLYIVLLGINSETVGTIDDVNDADPSQNADSFYGNIAKIYHELLNYAPNAKIIFARPPMITTEKATALQTLASRYGIPYMSFSSDPLFSTDFYTDNRASLHPLALPISGMALAMERQLCKCLLENVDYFSDYVGND